MKNLLLLFALFTSYTSGAQFKEQRKLIRKMEKATAKPLKEAEKGNIDAMLKLSLYYKTGIWEGIYYSGFNNVVQWSNWVHTAAYTGDPRGYAALGDYYEDRNNESYSKDSALYYYHKSIALGCVDGMDKLGYMYERGYLVNCGSYCWSDREAPQVDSAFKYYLQAATLGHVEFYYKIGYLYLLSNDLSQHQVAQIWFKKAAEQGYAPAVLMMSNYKEAENNAYRRSLAAQLAGDDTKAFELMRIAAEINYDTSAMVLLGNYYLNGYAVKKNEFKGLWWFEKSGAMGSGYGYYAAGNYYYKAGQFERATDRYRKAALLNYNEARYMVSLSQTMNSYQSQQAEKSKSDAREKYERAVRDALANPNSGQITPSTQIIKARFCYDCDGTGKIFNVFNGVKLSSWHVCGACGGKGYIK